jgi:hypothetical protein
MELLGDVGHEESRFGLFESVLVSVQDKSTVCTKRTIASELFWMHLMELLGDVSHVEPHFDPFRDSVSFGSG